MKFKSFLSYSGLLGIGAAIVVVLVSLSSVSERHEQLIVKKLRDTEEITQVIGEYKSFSVRRYENYSGTSEDQPSLEYMLNVTGDKGSVYVTTIIMSPNTNEETITVGLHDN